MIKKNIVINRKIDNSNINSLNASKKKYYKDS